MAVNNQPTWTILGAAQVGFDGVDLGLTTEDGTAISGFFGEKLVENSGQTGKAGVEVFLLGSKPMVKVTLKQFSKHFLEIIFGTAIDTTGGLLADPVAGVIKGSNRPGKRAKKGVLTIDPLVTSPSGTDYESDATNPLRITGWRAVCVSDPELVFSATESTTIELEFELLEDLTRTVGDRIYTIGVIA
jgi:hypothetical protein